MKKVRKIKFRFKHTLGSCASNNRSCNEVEEIIQGDGNNENSGDNRKNIHGKGGMALGSMVGVVMRILFTCPL